jgi:hypothetical protein
MPGWTSAGAAGGTAKGKAASDAAVAATPEEGTVGPYQQHEGEEGAPGRNGGGKAAWGGAWGGGWGLGMGGLGSKLQQVAGGALKDIKELTDSLQQVLGEVKVALETLSAPILIQAAFACVVQAPCVSEPALEVPCLTRLSWSAFCSQVALYGQGGTPS